ncbi:alpha-1,3-galactosidase-related protein [Streptomyces sp. NPDC054804]
MRCTRRARLRYRRAAPSWSDGARRGAARASHDDPINIHGTYLEVVGQPGPNTLTLAYEHPQTAGFPQFAPGDEVEFTTKRTMTRLSPAHAKVTAVDGPSGMDHDKPLTTMTVSFDRPVPAGTEIGGTVVENITPTPSVLISGNVFRNVPTRGVLVTTRKPVLITGNTVRRLAAADQPPYTSPLFVFHGSSGIRIAHNHYAKGLNTSVVAD